MVKVYFFQLKLVPFKILLHPPFAFFFYFFNTPCIQMKSFVLYLWEWIKASFSSLKPWEKQMFRTKNLFSFLFVETFCTFFFFFSFFFLKGRRNSIDHYNILDGHIGFALTWPLRVKLVSSFSKLNDGQSNPRVMKCVRDRRVHTSHR